MKVLITVSSKHGATAEIADAIAQRMASAGFTVDQVAPDAVESLDPYDAVIVGSAVYMTQWMAPSAQFMQRFSEQLRQMPVWAFSVGLSGVPKNTPQDPSRIGPVLTKVNVVHHQMFPGRYRPTKVSLRERTIARLAGAVEGDFRDWKAVDRWTDQIVAELRLKAVS